MAHRLTRQSSLATWAFIITPVATRLQPRTGMPFWISPTSISNQESQNKSMKHRLLLLLAALCVMGVARAEKLSPIRVDALTCEHLTNPIGIGNQQPRLSW